MNNMHPLFILGNPRSGTSLLRIMLTTHSSICIPPECGFIQWWWGKYKSWSRSDSLDKRRVDSYLEDLKSSKKIDTWMLDFDFLKEVISQLTPDNYAQLSLCVILTYAKQRGKRPTYLGDKNNYYLHYVPLLSDVFPDAKYVAILRDGRDVACSYKRMANIHSESPYTPELPEKIEDIAKEWVSNNDKMLRSLSMQDIDSYLTIKYEDLILDTKSQLSDVCEGLDIQFEPKMLEYYKINRQEVLEPAETLDWKQKTLEKPDASNIGKYKTELSASEIARFNTIAIKSLQKYGYED